MSFVKNSAVCFALAALGGALAGCQEDPAKQGGTYTAARHMSTGSHLPQASDVNSTNSVYSPPTGNNIGGTSVSSQGGGR